MLRKLIPLLALIAIVVVGCNGGDPIFVSQDADGHYAGWVHVDNPGMGFNDSFYATLSISDSTHRATFRDDRGRTFYADHVDYSYWTDNLEIFFRVPETRWNPECGNEYYNWEMRLNGRLYTDGDYRGEIESDIDPEDYHSDHCYLDYNPPPRHLGSFVLEREFGVWW
jgi:hypothetical protein